MLYPLKHYLAFFLTYLTIAYLPMSEIELTTTVVKSDDIIHRIASSRRDEDQLDLITLLDDIRRGLDVPNIADKHSTTRTTVYRQLDYLVDAGFIAREDVGSYQLTRAGKQAADAYRNTVSVVGDQTLEFLAGSSDRRVLLKEMKKGARTKAAFSSGNDLPSRTTVHRAFELFDDRSWIQETEDGRYGISEDARVAIIEYEQLAVRIQQAAEKSPCVSTLAYWADPPLDALTGSELVVEPDDGQHAMLNATIESANLRDDGLDQLRTVVPVFDPVMYDVFNQYIDSETTFEIIFDQETYQELTEPKRLHYLARSILAPNTTIRIHPDPLYTGLGIYNGCTVMLGGSSRLNPDAGIVSNKATLLRWANEKFEELWIESSPPSRRLIEWIRHETPLPKSWTSLIRQQETV